MALADRHTNDFLQEIKKLDPELRRSVNGFDGLLHMQMGSLSQWVQAALNEARLEDFIAANEIIVRYFQLDDSRLDSFNNAVFVSYLEHLVFEGEAGIAVWDLFPLALKAGYREIMAYLDAVKSRYPEHLTRKERFHSRAKNLSKTKGRA